MTADPSPFGVYVHVPYCKSICPYCDFNVHVAKPRPWGELAGAWQAELDGRGRLFGVRHAASLYFGGGTPSLAPPETLAVVVDAVRKRWLLPPDAEVTLEVEPKTVDLEGLRLLRQFGVNRISLGWQSTHDRLLRVLGRGHRGTDSRAAFDAARAAGFGNISIDLIFAVPGQTMHDLDVDLSALIALGPEHVSLYALTWHEGTHCYRRLSQGRIARADEAIEVAMMERIHERLSAADFEQYEVSNYARPGFVSVHNRSYWLGAQYLGLGPGAHSFVRQGQDGFRWEAVRDPKNYLAAWQAGGAGALPAADDGTVEWIERLDARQLLTERMMCAVRMAKGVSLSSLELGDFAEEIHAAASEARRRGWLEDSETRIIPTRTGLRHADGLALLFA